jgi:hypothetical protein
VCRVSSTGMSCLRFFIKTRLYNWFVQKLQRHRQDSFIHSTSRYSWTQHSIFFGKISLQQEPQSIHPNHLCRSQYYYWFAFPAFVSKPWEITDAGWKDALNEFAHEKVSFTQEHFLFDCQVKPSRSRTICITTLFSKTFQFNKLHSAIH